MSHEPTREEWVAAAVAYANARQAAGKTMDSGPPMQNALTAANTLRDRRIRNEALEEAALLAEEFDCGTAEADDVQAGQIADAIRALKDKEPNHE